MEMTRNLNDSSSHNQSASTGPLEELPLQAVNDEILPVSKFPPPSVFERATTYPALIVPVRRTAELRKLLTGALLHLPKVKHVYHNPDDDETRKLVLRGEEALADPRVRALLEEGDCQPSSHILSVSYADRSVEQVLRLLLPTSIPELPSAFEIVGSIAHLNLRPELLPFKYIVGKVILDKNQPRIQTVVNKLGSIANEYRTFGMEVIAGVDNPGWSLVKVKEEGCEFTLDFQQVYWNSRLGCEHKRLVQQIRKDAQQRKEPTIVADLMAGVGPFAVPLTATYPSRWQNNNWNPDHKNVLVHANDLNPASYKYLKINGTKNKCPGERLVGYNMDARAFCHKLQDDAIDFHHAIMNLPASAPEFLDCFRGFTNSTLPWIHVYCFAPKPAEDDPSSFEKEVVERCSRALGCKLETVKHQIAIRIVRDVSPKKNMVCACFRLPEEARHLSRIHVEPRLGGIGTGEEGNSSGNECEPKAKKCKTSEND